MKATSKTKVVTYNKMRIFLGKASIEREIISIGRRGKKFERDVQKIALSIAHHIEFGGKEGTPSGDYTKANDLITVMPKGIKVNALIDWFTTFSWVAYNEEEKCLVYDKKDTSKIEEGAKKMWSEFRPEPEYKPMNLEDAVVKLITTAQYRLERQTKESDPVKLKNYKQDKVTSSQIEALASAIHYDLDQEKIIPPAKTKIRGKAPVQKVVNG